MRTLNEDRLNRFEVAYTIGLAQAVEKHPDEYGYPVEQVPAVVDKMMRAVLKGDYNHNGYGFKYTCRELGIKHTRKAIEAFLKGEDNG